MAYVKLTEGKHTREQDVSNALEYILDIMKCRHGIYGGCNIIAYNIYEPAFLEKQFLAIQYRRRFTRRIYHVIISFDWILDNVDLQLAQHIGQAVANMYMDYQSVFAVHEDKRYLHIHMILNNCAVFPENKNLTSTFNIFQIQELVDKMIDCHLGLPDMEKNSNKN